jgi:hypothetical protein
MWRECRFRRMLFESQIQARSLELTFRNKREEQNTVGLSFQARLKLNPSYILRESNPEYTKNDRTWTARELVRLRDTDWQRDVTSAVSRRTTFVVDAACSERIKREHTLLHLSRHCVARIPAAFSRVPLLLPSPRAHPWFPRPAPRIPSMHPTQNLALVSNKWHGYAQPVLFSFVWIVRVAKAFVLTSLCTLSGALLAAHRHARTPPVPPTGPAHDSKLRARPQGALRLPQRVWRAGAGATAHLVTALKRLSWTRCNHSR